jgi:hypothetical protein
LFRSPLALSVGLALGCFTLAPLARAVSPPPDGGYINQNTAEGDNALFSLTSDDSNTAIGFQVLFNNTTGKNNTANGVAVAAHNPPPYKYLRYDEDYGYLRDSSQRTDFIDAVKYIPLNQEGDWYLTLGGEARERYEYFHNNNWGAGPQDDNGFFLQRYMIYADAHFTDHFRIFTQFESGLEDGRNGGPSPTDEDQFDLLDCFVDGKLTWDDNDSFTLRLGREEMFFGSGRLVSAREPPNVRQEFDGVRGIFRLGDWRVDAFAVKPVETNPGIFDDRPNFKQKFWGVYGVTPVSFLPGGHVDLYYLGLERQNAGFNQGSARELRHSVGARIWGEKQGWDYNLEMVYQFGTFGDGNISAWTAASDTGYSFRDAPLKPRLALKTDIASGDRNPNDPNLETFNGLFPKGEYYTAALIGLTNVIDLHPYIELKLTNRVSFTVDWDFFWRESTRDGIYGPGVNLVRATGTSRAREIGNQVQVLVQWQIQRHLTFTAGYLHFFAGDFLKETQPGKDVDHVSTWLTFKF